MSSPTQSTSGRDPRSMLSNSAADRDSAAQLTSALALSGLLKVQRRWTLASRVSESPETGQEPPHGGGALRHGLIGPARTRLNVHLEDSEWSRLALGIAADVLSSLGVSAGPEVLQLDPDSVTVHLPVLVPPRPPFEEGSAPGSWSLPRDSRLVASLPVTPAISASSGRAGLVTLSEAHGRRILVDLVGLGSTILQGAPGDLGVKLADIVVELASRRWSDLGSLILVAFDEPLAPLGGARHVRDLAAALEEATVRSMSARASSSLCVVVPPWASDPTDPLLGELVRFGEETVGVGILCCANPEGALSLWELPREQSERPILNLADGRRFEAAELEQVPEHVVSAKALPKRRQPETPAPGAEVPIEIAVLGNVQVNGAPESFRHRRRLTELVVYLAVHPEGATSDAFATALWPERRVPVQTLANRLSETRRALGLAADGRPRLRKAGRRHLIAGAITDWERFKDLGSKDVGDESWRKALALVRGRPFDGLEQGEWAQLEGFTAAIEALVVEVACRLGDHSISHGEPGIAHWAALQGLLVSPWDERLYRLLMHAADAMGNRGGVDAALRSLAVALEIEGDPLFGIHPETVALYRRLTSRPRA